MSVFVSQRRRLILVSTAIAIGLLSSLLTISGAGWSTGGSMERRSKLARTLNASEGDQRAADARASSTRWIFLCVLMGLGIITGLLGAVFRWSRTLRWSSTKPAPTEHDRVPPYAPSVFSGPSVVITCLKDTEAQPASLQPALVGSNFSQDICQPRSAVWYWPEHYVLCTPLQ